MIAMHTFAELAAAIHALHGARVVSLGRTLNMAEVGLTRGDDLIRLHVQCPFRVVQGGKVLTGSTDMRWPLKRNADPAEAYDTYQTQFDRGAKILTERLATGVFPVLDAEMTGDGAFRLTIVDDVRFESFPATAGPVECWRLFVKGSDLHYVYPPSATLS
jgi:hypothetical protein